MERDFNKELAMIIIKPTIEIIDMADYQDILKKIERIGRVCYKSESVRILRSVLLRVL